MKVKILFTAGLMLVLSACDNTEQTTQQQTSAKPDTAVVTELASAPEVTPMEESTTQVSEAPAEPVVAQVSEPMSGEAIYKKTCMACHASGAAGAPKLGDKQAWKPRIDKGMDALMQSALNGVPGTSMVKRGTCTSCSDEELRAAVEYMVEQSK